MVRYIQMALGFVSLLLGLLGIVTPGLPTTPFLLLSAYLFARSSPRLHAWLHENKITGYYLNKMKGGLSIKARLIPIAIMWCMVLFTSFVVFTGTMRYVMLGLGVIGTIAQFIVLGRDRARQKHTAVEEMTEEDVAAE